MRPKEVRKSFIIEMLVYVLHVVIAMCTDVGVSQFANAVTPFIDLRGEALTMEPGIYKFSPSRSCCEGDYEVMARCNNFIDKSSAYKQLFHANEARSYHVKFPRRFGKTTLLSFLSSTLSLQAGNLPTKERYRRILEATRTLDEGDFFIKQKLSPSVWITFGNVRHASKARNKLWQAFRDVGVNFCVDDKSTDSEI